MKAGSVITRAAKREQVAPQIAKQNRENRGKEVDGGLHAINRSNTRSRVQEAAAATVVEKPKKKRWRRASHLPALQNPPGFSLKWVRRDGRERGDCRGLARYIQEQWEFARKEDFPKHTLPTQSLSGHGEVIGNGDMILMKLDEELVDQRNDFYQTRRDTATHSVEKGNLDETSTIMPAQRPKRSSRTEFIRFRKRRPDAIEVAQDEE